MGRPVQLRATLIAFVVLVAPTLVLRRSLLILSFALRCSLGTLLFLLPLRLCLWLLLMLLHALLLYLPLLQLLLPIRL